MKIIILGLVAIGSFLSGAYCSVYMLLYRLEKSEKQLKYYKELHKNKYDIDEDYHAY
jgi:hypothetical protein